MPGKTSDLIRTLGQSLEIRLTEEQLENLTPDIMKVVDASRELIQKVSKVTVEDDELRNSVIREALEGAIVVTELRDLIIFLIRVGHGDFRKQ